MTHIQLHTYILLTLLHLTHTITHIHTHKHFKQDRQTNVRTFQPVVDTRTQTDRPIVRTPAHTDAPPLSHRPTQTDTHRHTHSRGPCHVHAAADVGRE